MPSNASQPARADVLMGASQDPGQCSDNCNSSSNNNNNNNNNTVTIIIGPGREEPLEEPLENA
jgi:hypothetical protein